MTEFQEADTNWPFPDDESTEVITLDRILKGESPLRLVTHDADDGCWQFLDGEHVFEEDAVLMTLGEMVQIYPSLLELADLPRDGYAWRSSFADPWQRGTGDPPLEISEPSE